MENCRQYITEKEQTYVDNTKEPPTVLSLCSGYGGLEIGLERVFGKITVLAHVEVEAFAVANLVNKMETGQMAPAPIWTDIETFKAGLFRGLVDILTGGYPCQPFSVAGKRRGSEDARHLWPFVRETIRACEPRRVFLENVEGHLSKGIAEVLADLEKMGYRSKVGIFSATEVGTPHQRKRVFILAHPDSRRLGKQNLCMQQQRGAKDIRSSENQKLADTEEYDGGRLRKWGETLGPHKLRGQWPTRPGEPQHPWEAPRIVADTDTRLWPKQSRSNIRPVPGGNEPCGGESQQIKPRLGGASHGPANRVDRLRLLGNGVVPQTAEKAFRTLYGKL